MHLKKIKLAGFKSFVDPTVMPFRSNRTAIVGPNGCGKSNIIDAVRWVMGESSAKQLRGEAMSDVIFNGSNNRKPLGQASIELFFDNSAGKIGGELANYNEIAIRREVNRDGLSCYYLNGTRCRRKDIVDVFLGTGLGPRSYAIIEQGMISQLIEAKPDELRAHLEEAAGISKYKERRRETENRIRHTRDNLDRLHDIREELESQLRRLKRQASAAERYKVLKQEQRLYKAQLQALYWRTIRDEVGEQEQKIKLQEVALEAKLAKQSKIISVIEKFRSEQGDVAGEYNSVQERFYRLGAEIGRLEQKIQHNKERCLQLNQDLHQLEDNWQKAQFHIENDSKKLRELDEELILLEPQTEHTGDMVVKANAKLQSAEEAMYEWRIAWDSFNDEAAQCMQQAEVERTRINHIEQRIDSEKQQLEKLQQEFEQLSLAGLPEEIEQLQTQHHELNSAISASKLQLADKQEQISLQREHNNRLANELNEARQQLQKSNGRQSSLEALQQEAFNKNNQQLTCWLQQNELLNNTRLAQEIMVETGWEKAVETVLSRFLEAVCVESLTDVSKALENFASGKLALIGTTIGGGDLPQYANTLASKVESKWSVHNLLQHIYIADNLLSALNIRQNLKSHESVITQDGVWLGNSWTYINQGQDAKHGILKREKELQELENAIDTLNREIIDKDELLQKGRKKLSDLEFQRGELQDNFNQLSENYAAIFAELSTKKSQLEHFKQREVSVKQQIAEHDQNSNALEEQLINVRDIWERAEENKLTANEKRESLLKQRDMYQENLILARDYAGETKEQSDKLLMRVEFGRNQKNHLQENLLRSDQQISSLVARREQLKEALQNAEAPLEELNLQLQTALEKRLLVEEELTNAKRLVEKIEYELRQAEQQNNHLQVEAQNIREELSTLKMEWKALQVRATTYEEKIVESGFVLAELLPQLTDESAIQDWEAKLENIAKKIERLGPINLAAIDEYTQQSERKQYLDAQNDDLVQALDTLAAAIRKIDRETRLRFKDTFESVNVEFQRLFPLIFGGGNAALEMTGDDLLSTGIMIMAQPPGKRNSTIHLLSGGEKALTAIALVFSIFQLNPAPFCMLDEVDAPLDDNNILRFCNLVREISEKIQIIFISHNKTTMEMADQLAGVTMHEPGVSRIVSVDIQEAISMVEN